jgi:hypothetical protein
MSGTDLNDTMSEIKKIKEEYIQNRSTFIKGEHMAELLKGLGATEAGLETIIQVSDSLPDDPTLPFRKSKNGRFYFNIKSGRIDRLEFQPFILSADEDFVRHDSGRVRKFAEIGNDLQLNSVLQALLRFKALMIQDVNIARRSKLDYDSSNWVCTLFNLRTVTTPDLVCRNLTRFT